MKNLLKVEQFYNKNQFIMYGQNILIFQSYNSIIACIDKNELTLFSNWDFSLTTRKHLYLFLEENKSSLDFEIYNKLTKALESSNKRQAIQKLIDEKVIQYSTEY